MALSKSAALAMAQDQLWPLLEAERERLKIIDQWAGGRQPDMWKPRTANSEHNALMERGKTPLLMLVVNAMVQAMYVDGYRSPQSATDDAAWKIWQANGWDARQVPTHRSTANHGLSYVSVLPGRLRGERMPVVRGSSAKDVIAVYRDPANDEWAEYVGHARRSGEGWHFDVIDEELIHTLAREPRSDKFEYVEARPHEMDEVPYVRIPNMLDLDGRCVGEVEPFIPIAARFDQVTFDRLMVQRYASWKVRYVTGMAKPETTAEEQAKKLSLAQDDILIAANKDTSFGTLDETSPDGFIKAGEFDLRTLAATSQTPPQYFIGDMTNLSADALAMAEATLMRKVHERQTVIGEAHEQWLRLGASWLGQQVDDAAQVKWRDVESRSLAQVADALGKIASQLQFPAQILWEKIPGLTQTDIEEAKRLVESGNSLQQLMDELERQSGSTADDNPAA